MIARNFLTKLVGMVCLLNGVLNASRADPVLTRVPDGGIQPQAISGSDGVVHLIYYKGDPKAGDLFYVRRSASASTFSEPIRINSRAGSAIAIGTIRGAQVALGRNGRVHVAWNGSGKPNAAGMMYTRSNDGTAFEPERNLMTVTEGLDGGGSLAADSQGKVYVVWQALGKNSPQGETNRAVFVAVSTNDGASFEKEKMAVQNRLGACACCGMKAYVAETGKLFVFYRAAQTDSERDETLLESDDGANSFKVVFSHPWSVSTCPMSSAWLGGGISNNIVAGWETKGRTWFMNLSPGSTINPEPYSISTTPGQKHPVAVGNAVGQTLVVWTEGTGWQKGGSVVWRIIDSQRKTTSGGVLHDGVPVWSFAAAVSRAVGTYEIFY